MKLPSSDIFKGSGIFYILMGCLLPVIYIIFLLMFNYRNNVALQESSIKRFKLDIEKHAAMVGYFFLERKYDIRNIADSTETSTYFVNRSLGMSEQYGLKVSLFSINQLMEKNIRDKKLKNDPIYKKFALVDQNRKLLVNTPPFNKSDTDEIASINLTASTGDHELIIEKRGDGYEILLTAPCFFRKKISGWIIAWMDPDVLYKNFMESSLGLSSKVFGLTLENGEIIKPSDRGNQNFSWGIPPETVAGVKEMELISISNAIDSNLVNKRGNGSTKHLATQIEISTCLFTRIQIQTLPLFLSAYVSKDEILGNLQGWQFLAGTGALTFLIVLGLVLFLHAKTRHLILSARFEESEKQQDILTKKNRQLEEAEQILKENEERYRKLFESSSDPILIITENKIIDCNQKTYELLELDRDKIIGHTFYTFSPKKQTNGTLSETGGVEKIASALEEPQFFEWTFERGNNRLVETEINMTALTLGSATCIQVIIRDITERKRTQEIMVQTEKMMAVGGLAAGMAHEINNPLGIILQANQNLGRRISTDLKKNHEIALSIGLDFDKFQTYLKERTILNYVDAIQVAGERAGKIVKSMLAFGRTGNSSKKEMCNVNELMESAIEMASNDYDLKKKYDFKNVEIIRQYSDIKPVICEPTEICQVFLNIIKNAAQAMLRNDSQNPPIIIISTKQVNGSVMIEIEDNGPGIENEMGKKIFEPFFTTKPVGEGTGLGLSVSYFIISTHHNGKLRVESKKGSGSRFIIELPVGYNLK